jgi:hypothetical protein
MHPRKLTLNLNKTSRWVHQNQQTLTIGDWVP